MNEKRFAIPCYDSMSYKMICVQIKEWGTGQPMTSELSIEI